MANDRQEVGLSEYGADCFDVSGNAERCESDRVYAADRWFPFYVDGVLVGHVKIAWDGSTNVVLRPTKDHRFEIGYHHEAMVLYRRLGELEYGTKEYHQLEERLEKLDAEIQRRCEEA